MMVLGGPWRAMVRGAGATGARGLGDEGVVGAEAPAPRLPPQPRGLQVGGRPDPRHPEARAPATLLAFDVEPRGARGEAMERPGTGGGLESRRPVEAPRPPSVIGIGMPIVRPKNEEDEDGWPKKATSNAHSRKQKLLLPPTPTYSPSHALQFALPDQS